MTLDILTHPTSLNSSLLKAIVLAEAGYEQEWKDFVTVHGSRMFQIALVLCGGRKPAENAFIASVEDLDPSMPPGKTISLRGKQRLLRGA
jgi:hypothetical protein